MKSQYDKIIKIDYINSVSFYDEYIICNVKQGIYNEFAEQENRNFLEYQYLLTNINPGWRNDIIQQCQTISNNLSTQNKKFNLNSNLNSKEITSLTEKFTKKEFMSQSFLLESHVENLSQILVKSFTNIEKKYNIYSFDEFLKRLNGGSSSRDNSFNTTPLSKINSTTTSTVNNTISHSKELKKKSSKKVKTSGIDNLNQFPLELSILTNSLITVQNIKINIPSESFILDTYLIILMNMSWLFPSLYKVELDIETPSLYSNINTTDKTKRTISYEDFIKQNNLKFILMILFYYYVGKLENLKILFLKIPESFLEEIHSSLKLMDVEIKHFHILDLFYGLTSLIELSIEFNVLDTNVFKRITGLLHNNNKLRILNINFFPENREIYFEQNTLFRLCNAMYPDTKKLLKEIDGFYSNRDPDNKSDLNGFFLEKLINDFRNNLERLFIVLIPKISALKMLTISIDFPLIIKNNKLYITLFQKFLMNLFLVLEDSEQLKTIELNCKDFPFDSVKYPILDNFFDKLNLNGNAFITNLKLNFSFRNIMSINNFIPNKIQELTIGDLDTSSFSSFVLFLKRESSLSGSNSSLKQLKYLKITIAKRDFNLDYGYKYLREFFSFKKPSKLKELIFDSSLFLSNFQITEILSLINYDTIVNYTLRFSSLSKSINEVINLDENLIYYTALDMNLMSGIIAVLKRIPSGRKLIKYNSYYQRTILNLSKFLMIKGIKRLKIEFD